MVEDTNDHNQCFNGEAPLNLNYDRYSVSHHCTLHGFAVSIPIRHNYISSRSFPVQKFNVLLLPAIVQ